MQCGSVYYCFIQVCMSVCLSTCLSVCLSVCLFVCLSVCLYYSECVDCQCGNLPAATYLGNEGKRQCRHYHSELSYHVCVFTCVHMCSRCVIVHMCIYLWVYVCYVYLHYITLHDHSIFQLALYVLVCM